MDGYNNHAKHLRSEARRVSLIMARTTALFVLVSVLALCQAVPVFIPQGKEITYDYRAIIKTGAYEPAPYASEFFLHGKLHMQKLDNKRVAMKLTDLTYKLYNGELTHDHEEELVALPLSEEFNDIMKPFILSYNDHGEVEHIIFDKSDRKFSRNMKKGIGSLIQLDMEKIRLDAKDNYAFMSHENNVYGNIQVRYLVTPEHDEMVIEKMLDLQNSEKEWKAHVQTTEDIDLHEKWDRDPLITGAHRRYTLFKEDNEQLIKEINSLGSIYLSLMKGKSESQYMLVNQDLIWSQIAPVATPMTKPENELQETLKFDLGLSEDDEAFVDLSFDRINSNMEYFEKLVYSVIDDGIKNMKITHLKMEMPEMKMGMWMNRLVRIMGLLDLKTLEHMFVSMEEKTDELDKQRFDIFQEMLPLIGTRASTLLVRNLIRKEKVDEQMAIEMLTQLPFHLRMPSEKLLSELEDMIHLENVKPNIQRMSTLTFATLVNKVFTTKHMFTDETVKSELLEKYITKFMDLLKNAQDYSSQYLYMNALYNIRIGSVQKQLQPYVTGEATKNRHLRYLAMCASYSEVIHDRTKVFELYFPIFADPSLHLELRVGAYMTLMGSKPSKAKLLDIYWILKNDPCPELYHMHWSYLRSITFSTDPYFEGYQDMATEMLNFMREPMHHPLTGHYQMDFMDPNFGFGSLMSATFMSTNTSKAMYVDLYSDLYNFGVMDWAIWLKIDGMDPSIIRKTPVDIKNMEQNFVIEELMRTVMSLKEQKNLHVEYAILHNDKVIMMDYADHSNIDQLKIDIMALMDMRDLQLSFEQLSQMTMPNDLGLPTVIEFVMPTVSRNVLEITDEKNEAATVKGADWKDFESSFSTVGMAFYNPIPDVWQGVERIVVNEMISAMNFKLSMSKDFKLKLTVDKQNDESMDKFALRSYTTTVTHVYKDLNNELQKSSKNSHHYAKVSRGEQYRQTKMLFEHDCPHTGMHVQVGLFDNENHLSRRTMMEMWQDITQRYYKNYQTMPFGYFLLTLSNSINYLGLSPEVGTTGLLIRAVPSKKYPVNHIDISLRASVEHLKEGDHHLPNTKLTTRFTWATKNQENKVLHSWDTNANLDMNPGHTLNRYKIHFSSSAPEEKQFKMCIFGVRKWIDNKMVGHMNITLGRTEDPTTCVDNEGLIEIDMKGEQSDEQKQMLAQNIVYDKCHRVHMHEPLLEDLHVDYEEDIDCTWKQTSLRKFEYDVKTTGMSEKCQETVRQFIYHLRGLMTPFYKQEKSNIALDENTVKVTLQYPVQGQEMNLEFITPKNRHMIKELPNCMKWMGFRPESYHYTSLATWFHRIGMTESCMIVDQHMYSDNYEVSELTKDGEWMEVVRNNPEIKSDHSLTVFVKKIGAKEMGLRVKLDEKILEIIPEGESRGTYKITWEGKPLTVAPGSYHDEDIFSIGMMQDKHRTIIMHMYHFKLYIDYDGQQMRMDKRKMDHHLTGLCFMN